MGRTIIRVFIFILYITFITSVFTVNLDEYENVSCETWKVQSKTNWKNNEEVSIKGGMETESSDILVSFM